MISGLKDDMDDVRSGREVLSSERILGVVPNDCKSDILMSGQLYHLAEM